MGVIIQYERKYSQYSTYTYELLVDDIIFYFFYFFFDFAIHPYTEWFLTVGG